MPQHAAGPDVLNRAALPGGEPGEGDGQNAAYRTFVPRDGRMPAVPGYPFRPLDPVLPARLVHAVIVPRPRAGALLHHRIMRRSFGE
ncbi:hypothetical protein [Streptomyces regalis]|uniref:Uncharacterized protein n=1 Tax=Streptomyces regalis TaxID=68262 RepID=A0A0X3VFG5_9ACTN|nr:hypothetical protein [Streptomyces regalis]KUL43450.1 hypothetical protein ADL12_07590 [Streptomyces regalis]